jgi:hypothetical protein
MPELQQHATQRVSSWFLREVPPLASQGISVEAGVEGKLKKPASPYDERTGARVARICLA